MISQTNLQAFYEKCTDKDTAIVTASDIKDQLEKVADFDWEEFKKPIHEMDVKKLAESLKDTEIGGTWKSRKAKGDKPQAKQAIATYTLQKSTVAGIGSGKTGSAFLIRGAKSKFSSHPFNFGSQEEQDSLKTDIESIKAARKEMFASEQKGDQSNPLLKKKLCTFALDFEISAGETPIQEESAVEQFKYLYLLQALIANQVAHEVLGGSPRDSKSQVNVKMDGCMKSKYDDYRESDVLHANFQVDAIPIYEDNKACQIVNVQNPDGQYEEGSDIYTIVSPASVSEYISKLRMRNMDILVVVDQCFVKKQGRELLVMPKFKIQQAVLKDSLASKTRRHVGLRLLRD